MDTQQVGKKLVELCQKGEYMKAIDELYGKDILSVEAMAMGPGPTELKGFDAVKKKSIYFMEAHEFHKGDVEGPFVNGDKFAVRFDVDVTEKKTKQRRQMTEIGLYTVANGKIVREDFMYLMKKGAPVRMLRIG